jgi:hypothetical protein
MINHNGTTFYSSNGGINWTVVGNGAVAMTLVAPGPSNANGQTAWGLSKTLSQGDYTIWNYNIQSVNKWVEVSPFAAGIDIAVAPDTGYPWALNHNGTIIVGIVSGTTITWEPLTDVQDGGSFAGWSVDAASPQGHARSLGVGPFSQAWIINDQKWTPNSPDFQPLALTEFNSVTDAAWSLEPGGAQTITVSSNGTPWAVNSVGTPFYGGPGWGGGGGLEGQALADGRLPAFPPPRVGDAGQDATSSH